MRLLITSAAALAAACSAVPEPPPATAPSAVPAEAPAPPCTSPAHHAFDFWLGEWDVYGANQKVAGENRIERAEYGCLLTEHWRGADGITGQSYNFLDPGTNKWRQIWISGGVVIDITGGLTPSGAMKLEGTASYQSGGPALPFTGEWTPNPDGSVTQHFQQYDPATAAWTDWFVGTYVRKPGGAKP